MKNKGLGCIYPLLSASCPILFQLLINIPYFDAYVKRGIKNSESLVLTPPVGTVINT